MKKLPIILLIVVSGIIINKLNVSYAYTYPDNNYTLFYNEDMQKLSEDIKIYLQNIDSKIITNSSFKYSSILNQNYDFLLNYSLDYILDNKELYKDKIKVANECQYYDINYEQKTTNEYINVEEIYKITNKYFNVSNFIILNNDCLNDNYIALQDYNPNRMTIKITRVKSYMNNDDEIKAIVEYETKDKYLYTFINEHDELKIKQVEVLTK